MESKFAIELGMSSPAKYQIIVKGKLDTVGLTASTGQPTYTISN